MIVMHIHATNLVLSCRSCGQEMFIAEPVLKDFQTWNRAHYQPFPKSWDVEMVPQTIDAQEVKRGAQRHRGG